MLNAAEAAEACGWFEHAEVLLDDVTRLTQNPAIRAPAVARRSYLLADRGEFDRAYALSVDEAERAAPQDAALALALGALMALTHSLDIPRSLATAERALLLAGSNADSDCLLSENVARTYILAGRNDDARMLVKSALLHVDPASVVAVNLGTDLFYIEDYARARDVLERVVRLTREAGASGILSYALDQLAKLETRVGDLTRAYALEMESLYLTEPLGNKVALAATLAWLGLIEAMLGRDESTVHSLHALKIAEATNDRYNVVRARASLALDSLANGEAARAVTCSSLLPRRSTTAASRSRTFSASKAISSRRSHARDGWTRRWSVLLASKRRVMRPIAPGRA